MLLELNEFLRAEYFDLKNAKAFDFISRKQSYFTLQRSSLIQPKHACFLQAVVIDNKR